MDQKEEIGDGGADVGAGCPWKHSSGAVADFQQEPGEAAHALVLVKSQFCACWMQSTHRGLGLSHWQLLGERYRCSHGCSTALAAHTLLQAAEKSGSEKLFPTDGRMLRGLHRPAQEQFL